MAGSVARIAVDVSLPHLDKLFDYAIPPRMADQIAPGMKVRVRFHGRLTDGWVREITDHSDYGSELVKISTLVSTETLMSETQARLIRRVATHYAGSFADVTRLAIPARHAATEKAEMAPWPAPKTSTMPRNGLMAYPGGPRFLEALEAGEALRGFWQVLPRHIEDADGVDDWTRGVVQACVATLRAGKGVIIAVPDARDMTYLRSALGTVIGLGAIAELHSEHGPAARYRQYLALSRGIARVVIGTRSAVWAPVENLGLIVMVDESNDLHAQPRAPYPHMRDVAAMRAADERTALLFASPSRSAEIQAWVERGWLGAIEFPAAQIRRQCALVKTTADSDYALDRDPAAVARRIPELVFTTIRAGLPSGPVLVQVPRAGYVPSLACQRCRESARCPQCSGPLRRQTAAQQTSCRWCGAIVSGWTCPHCGGGELRATVVGVERTYEELAKAFPGVRIIQSSGDRIVEQIDHRPALVIATPGAEPRADGGYSAVIFLDTALMTERPHLRAPEQALAKWMQALSLVKPASEGGTAVVVGVAQTRTIQALVRCDPAGFAQMDLQERIEARFPPSVKYVTIDGPPEAVMEYMAMLKAPESAEVLGPVDTEDGDYQVIARAERADGAELVKAIHAADILRWTRKPAGTLRIQVDPVAI